MFLVGATVRLSHFLSAPGFWLDEARTALEVGARSPSLLLQPLAYGQAAAPGFLLLEKALFALGSGSDWVLRLLPLTASLAGLVIFLWLAWSLIPGIGALVAGGLFALAPALSVFAWQLKPYSLDVLVAVATVALVLRVGSRIWPLGLLGIAAVLLAVPARFILASVGILLLKHRRDATIRNALAAWSVAWLALFAILMLRFYPPSGPGTFLHGYWGNAFLDGRPGQALRLIVSVLKGWLMEGNTNKLVTDLLAVLFVGCALLGAYRMRGHVALLTAPLLLAGLASFLGRWPMADRVLLFALPAVVLLIGAGANALSEVRSLRFSPLLLLLIPAWETGRVPHYTEEAAAVAFARMYRGPDAVYITARSLPTWVYYSTDWEHPDRQRLARAAHTASPGGPFHPAVWWASRPEIPAPIHYRGYLEIWGQGRLRPQGTWSHRRGGLNRKPPGYRRPHGCSCGGRAKPSGRILLPRSRSRHMGL